MRMIAGIGASACLAVALTGCGNRCRVIEEADCAAFRPAVAQAAPPQPRPAPIREPEAPPPANPAVSPIRPEEERPVSLPEPSLAVKPPPAKTAAPGIAATNAGMRERLLGEGTADWAIPLTGVSEDHDDFPKSGSLAFAGKPAGLFGADENNAPVSITPSVPGVITIDFPDENISPDDFGVPGKPESGIVPESIQALPDTISHPLRPAPAPAALPEPKESGAAPSGDGSGFASLGLFLDPIPGEESENGEEESRQDADEPEAVAERESSTTGFMSRYNLEFEEIGEEPEPAATEDRSIAERAPAQEAAKEPAASESAQTAKADPKADPLLPGEDEFTFFGSLSDAFFKELSDG